MAKGHPGRLDHRGDLAALGQAEIAYRLHRDGGHQAHTTGVEFDVGYRRPSLMAVTLAGIWLRALSFMASPGSVIETASVPRLPEVKRQPGVER